ncbi:GNAT family N-acetyltransferase [Flavobacterium piscinae]|uniref:N-acetyltransferase n=1 Tax=Flavobacterium piscinae TaxID=2506424 RepID=A0A4Q1KZI8_9FLAO|nr:GNAT family protein [Flavobacterium piscinae]MBC8884110.1 GNAT family N-acetyltransferase [Flavobacterium piscinae]RXR34794.1 N-acetyltransferase [Flavobacterium piscinae]
MNTEILTSEIVLENEIAKLIPLDNPRNQELKEIIFDDDIWRYMGIFIRTETDFKNYLTNTLNAQKLGICYPFLIIDKVTGRVAGSSRYGYLNTTSEKCEIGWTWYGKDFQGTGLNIACKYELLKFGFESIGFRRIQFSADEQNIRSQKAIEKLGATREGVFRNNYIDSNGQSRNDVYFSIIKEEWNNIKQNNFNKFVNT